MELQEEKYSNSDFISILDHIEDIPQAELEEYLRMPENQELYEIYLLSKIKARRRKLSEPNIDRSWEKFQAKQKRRVLPYIFSAIGGAAAAAVVGIILFFGVQNKAELPAVVMNYDSKPQVIQIQNEDSSVETIDMTDSISFFVPSSLTESVLANNNDVLNTEPDLAEETKMRTLSTPRGMDIKVTLPDGSEVWLNAESSIQFPSTFSGKTREVVLTGEAYFKVSHDETRPFFVRTDDMTVKVLGTEFDLRNYETEATSVALVKGSISILQQGEEKALLEPGQGAVVSADNQIRVEDVDIYSRSQWVHGYFYFENYTLLTILKEISRWYNVGVVFNRLQAMDIKLHFSASRANSIEELIDNLNRMKLFTLKLEDNTVTVE